MLGALCADVCRELGVRDAADLVLIEKKMLYDLPNYLNEQIKPLKKKNLLAMIGPQTVSDLAAAEQTAFLPKREILESQSAPAAPISVQLSASQLHSVWRKEVLQFAACMLSTERSFVHFCGLLLAEEDGVGVHCEIVQDFLKERGNFRDVEQLLRNKMRENRSDKLLTGLCHPSLELRTLFLSEMQQFRMPEDPFADKIVAKLMERAENRSWEWHRRVAAIFSITHIAKNGLWCISYRRQGICCDVDAYSASI